MALSLTIRDETTDGRAPGETVVEFLTERVTVEELIRSRVYQEVQDYNQQKPEKFRGLVRPTDAEEQLNGFKLKTVRQVDWKQQFEAAKRAFEKNQVLILVDNRQVERLDETIDLRPGTAESSATAVTFLKLTPLVGG
jgi:hypothetical protein